MVEIREINVSVTRGITAAAAALSIATIVSGVIVGFVKPKDEAAHRFVLSTALIGMGCGAVYGLLPRSKAHAASAVSLSSVQSSSVQSSSVAPANSSWTGWRNFVVVRKVKESQDITSFYLKPADQAEIPNFQPGQFLTLKLEIPGQSKPTIRTYSLSDYADPCEYYRLSIKREPMAQPDLPPGLASNFMHDQVQEGSVIQAKPPSGQFVLDVAKSLPAVFISNGVGITPLISMAKACSRLNPDRPLWFIHGARDGSFHAFQDEVREIAQQNPNLHLHFRYSRSRLDDQERYHSMGYVDAELIREVLAREEISLDQAEYYLCGSPPFLQALRDGFKTLGVSEDRVFFEVFGGAKGASPAAEMLNGSEQGAEIIFAKSEVTLTWKPGDGTILEFAEAHDLNPEYSCRQGICLTCMCRLQSGEVDYVQPPVGTPEAGSVLICISQPKSSRVVLDL
ncbi:MAG TPA: 2Fe-2S iron-sulfur cluster-binding protein [Coleofasciculaceae cyanobacterium]|jgi:hypothetical protein